MALTDELIKKGVLKNERLIDAFRKVDRVKFVPGEDKKVAYVDEPLPIGDGQTISQPWTVAFMLEILEPKPEDNIMEIGYGSGWVTALLASIGANVYAIERVEALCKWGKENVRDSVSNTNVLFYCQDGTKGLPEVALEIGGFDKIIASATAQRGVPENWKEQLKVGGRIVAPVGESIEVISKKGDGNFETKTYPGFAFVPLIED
jgi:protein-L-isoaspartate(D-aspartate) O-methyltransferase